MGSCDVPWTRSRDGLVAGSPLSHILLTRESGPRREDAVFFGFDIFVLVIVALAILTLFAGVKTVPQGFNWTVERFGKYTNTLRPGLNLIVPYFDRVGRKMNIMEQAVDIPEQDVITKDNATVTVDGLAFFQVIDAAKASYEIANLDQAIVKQSQILEAEGRREAAFRDAEARERLAQAEAKATQMVSEAVAKGDVASLNYFVAQKYLEAFGKLAQSPNQKVLIIPMEASSVLGSLAGIGEIAKATFGTDGSGGGGGGGGGKTVPATPRKPSGPTGFTTPGYTPTP